MSMDLIKIIEDMEFISHEDAIFTEIHKVLEDTLRLTTELNSGYKTPEEVRGILSEITGNKIDDSVQVLTPFNTDFGRNIKIGKDVFINKSCILIFTNSMFRFWRYWIRG